MICYPPPWTTARAAVPRLRCADPENQDPTARELTLLDLLAAGYSFEQAAEEMSVTLSTAKHHAKNLKARWRTVSTAHLVGEGFHRGWLIPSRPGMPLDSLTARHGEILALTGCGASCEEIGAELGLAAATVRELIIEARGLLRARRLAYAVALWHCSRRERRAYVGARSVQLTAGQKRLVGLLASGLRPAGIMAELGDSLGAVDHQLAVLRHKTRSRSNFEVALYGMRSGQVRVPGRDPVELDPMDEAVCVGIAHGANIPEIAGELEMPVARVWAAWCGVRAAVGAASRLEAVLALYGAGVLRARPAPAGISTARRAARGQQHSPAEANGKDGH